MVLHYLCYRRSVNGEQNGAENGTLWWYVVIVVAVVVVVVEVVVVVVVVMNTCHAIDNLTSLSSSGLM